MPILSRLCCTAAVLSGLLGLGCDRAEVAVYEIPKEEVPAPAVAAPGGPADPHAGMAMSRPSLTWGALPEGWSPSAQTSGMRLATFAISHGEEVVAELAIIPMGGFAGTDEQLVNMWRTQLGLPELAASEAEAQGTVVPIGGMDGRLYEMAGTANEVPTRILVASATSDGVNYFFKLIGQDEAVSGQKDAFLTFLEGVGFTTGQGAVAGTGTGSAAPTIAGDRPWTAPSAWEELAPTQFLLAKYRVPGEAGAGAEVTVSRLGGDAGGLLPNVNRWRGQLNLGPVDEVGLTEMMRTVEVGGSEGTLVELEGTDLKNGTPARMLVVVVPTSTETWFFKMTGPIELVKSKAEEFLEFVGTFEFQP